MYVLIGFYLGLQKTKISSFLSINFSIFNIILSVYFVKYLIISKDYIIFFLIPFYVLYIPINYFVLLFYIRGGFSPDISDKKTLYFRIFFIDLIIKSMLYYKGKINYLFILQGG